MKKTICGVDVSKARLDVCIEPGHRLASFDNDKAGIAELAKFCREHKVDLVAMEASGGYERRVFIELWEQDMRVSERMCKQVSVSLPYRGDSHDDRLDDYTGTTGSTAC